MIEDEGSGNVVGGANQGRQADREHRCRDGGKKST